MPEHFNVTAVIVNCSPFVAKAFYQNPGSFPQYYSQYLQILIENFPFINDIELWNEPNASDFYLSHKDENTIHRPWNGEEFVKYVITTGVATLKALGFTGKVCGITFAENGIVGHKGDKKPAFANVLKQEKILFAQQLKDNREYGSFYFKPDFASEILSALAKRYKDSDSLPFDAFGIHPYPYFGRTDSTFAAKSLKLVRDFQTLLNQYNFDQTDLWITEVGARSISLLERSNYHAFEPLEQKRYIEDLFYGLCNDRQVKKIFWYKFQDEIWDLKQEKTFGVFDQHNNRKPAYYALRSVSHQILKYDGLDSIRDDFGYGAELLKHSVNPEIWSTSKNTDFAYALPSLDSRDGSYVLLIYPGRKQDDIFRILSKEYLRADSLGRIFFDLAFRAYRSNPSQAKEYHGPYKLKIDIFSLAAQSQGLFLEIYHHPKERKADVLVSTDQKEYKKIRTWICSDTDLIHLQLVLVEEHIHLCISSAGRKENIKLIPIQNSGLRRRLKVSVAVQRMSEDQACFVEIQEFRAARNNCLLQ